MCQRSLAVDCSFLGTSNHSVQYAKGKDSHPRKHSQDLAREHYVAFQTQEKQLNKLWVKVVKTKTFHLIRMGEEVPYTQTALLWGNTELLSALMPQKFVS